MIGSSLLILLLMGVTAVLLFLRRVDAPGMPAPSTAPGIVIPATTATASQNVGFLPLVSKPATATLTPTRTATTTPTVTATPMPLRLSFCDQSPGPLPIQDYATLTDTLTVEFPGILLDVDLELDIQHGYTGDLEITLSVLDCSIEGCDVLDSPTVAIVTRPGAPPQYCNQADIRAVFDDEAAASANQTCNPAPALSGSLRPEQPLALFDNLPASLLWQLTVSDQSTPDEGFLNRWCILATVRE